MANTIGLASTPRLFGALALLVNLVACGGSDGNSPQQPPASGNTNTDILAPPADGTGVQLVSPEFTLHPGDEVFKCYYTSIPSDVDMNVARFVSKMKAGSHHFILYQMATASQPDGTIDDCNGPIGFSFSNLPIWVYASSQPDSQLAMPDGVAMPFVAHQPVMLNMHYFNVGTEDLTAQVAVNLEFAQGDVQKAGSFVSFNTQINIPPNGTQTVSGTCTPPSGAQFFLMSTHTHSHATAATINKYVNGQIGDLLVQTDDWEHPTVVQYNPNFMTFASNEQLYYSCTYRNDTPNAITVGQSAIKNEMCMAVTYYFPATSPTFCF